MSELVLPIRFPDIFRLAANSEATGPRVYGGKVEVTESKI